MAAAGMETELASLRKLVVSMATLKRQQPQSPHLRELAAEATLQLLLIKEENKRLCMHVEDLKEQTTRSKQSLEASDLTLQNLLYEKSYYEKEIFTCRSFRSKVTDEAVALMPLDQFWASLTDSPEDQEMRAKAQGNEHELMKQRLVHENRQRAALVKQLEQLRQLKSTLLSSVTGQERILKDLQVQLRQVETTAKPLHSVLSPTASLRSSMGKSAELLPTPLYVLYAQLVAAGEALHLGCSTSLEGSVADAESFARTALAEQLDEARVGVQGGAVAQESAAKQEAVKVLPGDLYRAHPLRVELKVYATSGVAPPSARPPAALVTVVFEYLPALGVVTAHCPSPEASPLLASLFPGDDGSGLAIEPLAQLQGGTFRFSPSHPSRPYRWCQHLAGLDFVPTLPGLAVHLSSSQAEAVLAGLSNYRSQQRVPTLVQRLREAKQGPPTPRC
ncbi:Fms-interacting protein-domain-containing protein [Haematococcus lacustris]